MGARTREGAAVLGIGLQCPALRRQSATMTALASPKGIEPKRIRDGLKAHNISVAAGLLQFESSAFRIGHMGDIRLADVERTLSALSEVMDGFAAQTLL